MQWAVLKITDGTTVIDLLAGGFRLTAWKPAIAQAKNDGSWRDSPLSDGRRLAFRRLGNVVETLELTVSGYDQEAVITDTQNLRRLLEQAIQYWIARVPAEAPVWIEARAECETNSRYAYVYDYRTPQDGDPYGAEFQPTSLPGPAFVKWPLYLERGHWLSNAPGTTTCVPTSNTQAGYTYGANLVANYSFETAGGGGADVFASWTETAGDGAIASEAATIYHLTKSAKLTSGPTANTQITQNVAVSASSLYLFSFYSYGSTSTTARYEVYDQTNGATITNVVAATLLASNTWSKTSVLVTTPVGCVSVQIRLKCASVNTTVLYIDYVSLRKATALSIGQEATCSPDAFQVNKSAKAQLTDCYAFDASAGTFSANKIGAALPYDLLPNPAAVGDFVYFGIDDGAMQAGPFSSLAFDLLQPGTGTLAGTWEYWNGAAWAAIPTINDRTSSLTAAGVYALAFIPPAAWVKATVNGIYGYFVRFSVTGLGGGAPQPRQQNRQPYTIINPVAVVVGDQILGDLPALIKHHMTGLTLSGSGSVKEFILWTRSLARGSRFDPFLNFSNVQKESEILLSLSSVSIVADLQAPTGARAAFLPAGAGDGIAQIEMLSPLCDHYRGSFRVYLRVLQTGGVAGDMSASLTAKTNVAVTTERKYTTVTGALEVLELGQITLPAKAVSSSLEFYSFIFTVDVSNTNGAGGNLAIYDLALIPIDECALHLVPIYVVTPPALNAPFYYAAIDATNPKAPISADYLRTGQIDPGASWRVIGNRPPYLSPGEDQMIGIFSIDDPVHHLVVYNDINRVSQYLSMRGNR